MTRLAQDALSATGKDEPVTILQPFLVLNFCIALDGIFPASRDRRERRVVVTNQPAMRPVLLARLRRTPTGGHTRHRRAFHSFLGISRHFLAAIDEPEYRRHRPPARRGGGGPHADEVHSDNRICTKRHYQC